MESVEIGSIMEQVLNGRDRVAAAAKKSRTTCTCTPRSPKTQRAFDGSDVARDAFVVRHATSVLEFFNSEGSTKSKLE